MISWGKRNRGLLFFQARQGRAPHPERKWCTTFIAKTTQKGARSSAHPSPSRCSTELSQAAQFGGRHVLAETDTPEGYFHFTPLLFVGKS
jgi:hypothetical protein